MNAKKALEKLYKDFSKAPADAVARIAALVQAVDVMDRICAALRLREQQSPGCGALPPDATKIWDRIGKLRAQAGGTTFEAEKETALRICLQYMERMAVAITTLPKLAAYTEAKASETIKSSKIAKTPKTPGAKSNKLIVYEAWTAGTSNPKILHTLIREAVQLSSIKGWLNDWKKGKNFPTRRP